MNTNQGRVEWIDFAKGVAILMVIAVHLSQALPLSRCWKEIGNFGAMGVQLFFILSAYCLCMTDKGESFSVRHLVRKYRRLLPWYLFGILLYAGYAFVQKGMVGYSLGDVVANVLLINDFIPSAQNSVVPGGWSISCIALFAFAYPLARKRFSLLCCLGVAGIAVSAVGLKVLGWTRFYAYCNPLNQLVVFAFGVALWRFRERLKEIAASRIAVVGLLGLGLSVAAVFFGRENAIFCRQALISVFFVCALALLQRLPLRVVAGGGVLSCSDAIRMRFSSRTSSSFGF